MKKTLPKLLGVAAATVPTLPALLFPGGEKICGKAAADTGPAAAYYCLE